VEVEKWLADADSINNCSGFIFAAPSIRPLLQHPRPLSDRQP
jgi:hypothetical protein